jgi:hypothetical protein
MHRMYRPSNGSDLCQGDVIGSRKLTPALVGHQDYIAQRTDFEAFCVMTQSCDLVRPREAEFITLAVARKITNIFDKSDARKSRTADSLKNIVQHRANTRYFYLYPELEAGISEDSVVDLRVMFALHKKHYDQIVAARTMGMNELYAAHLGWMAGNVFSRIAMPEWQDLNEVPVLEQKIKSLQAAIQENGQFPADLEKPVSTPVGDPIQAAPSV